MKNLIKKLSLSLFQGFINKNLEELRKDVIVNKIYKFMNDNKTIL